MDNTRNTTTIHIHEGLANNRMVLHTKNNNVLRLRNNME